MKKLLLMITALLLFACEKEVPQEVIPNVPDECLTENWEVGKMFRFNHEEYDAASFRNLIFPFMGYSAPYRLSDLCSNKNGSINRYSYVKPIQTGSVERNEFDDNTYTASTKLINYRIGDALPTDYRAIYIPATSHFKLSDFDGYEHGEYPCKLDLSSIPTQWDYDYYSEYFNIYHNGSSRALLHILINNGLGLTYWDTALLIVANKGNVTRYFVTGRENFSNWRVRAFVGFGSDVYETFKKMDLGTYTCTVVGIIIPYTHPDKEQSIHEVFPSSGWSYPLIPECFGSKPYKKGITISTPRDRCFYEFNLYDTGNSQDYYTPMDMTMRGYIRTPDTIIWQGPRFTWEEVVRAVGTTNGGTYKQGTFIIEPGDDSITAEFTLPDYYHEDIREWVKPVINGTNASDLTYDAVLRQTDFKWIWPNIQDGKHSFYVSFQYHNPYNRPER